MKYNPKYVDFSYDGKKLNEIFIKEFIRFRKENNLTQEVFGEFSRVPRENSYKNLN